MPSVDSIITPPKRRHTFYFKMNFVHIFFIGVIILVGAIVINLIVGYFGISTWFVFSESIKQIGFVSAIKKESFVSLLFLFITQV